MRSGRSLLQPNDDQRQHQRAGVGQHVSRIGQQRERVTDYPGHDFDRHEANDQRQRHGQVSPIRVCRYAVRMTVMAMTLMVVCVLRQSVIVGHEYR